MTMISEGAISINPFRIDVPQGELNDLRQRLARTRFAPDIPGVGWAYGTPAVCLRDVVA
jgi:hypothetical protein